MREEHQNQHVVSEVLLPKAYLAGNRIANVPPYAANNSVDRCGSDVLFQCELQCLVWSFV
jgi:hypothetical protein